MSHKVHPKSFRIKETADWASRGFYGAKTGVVPGSRYRKGFPEYLKEDFEIREFLGEKLADMGIEKIEIERLRDKLNIIISSARPGLIIGRRGEGVEVLKKALERRIFKKRKSSARGPAGESEIRIEIREVKNVWVSAPLVGQWIAQQIERRVPFRRVMKGAIEKVTAQKDAQGVRVEIAGRLDGASIARREWLRKGRLPRQTLRADIDYAQEKAHCTYGVIGVKVWIYKGEKF